VEDFEAQAIPGNRNHCVCQNPGARITYQLAGLGADRVFGRGPAQQVGEFNRRFIRQYRTVNSGRPHSLIEPVAVERLGADQRLGVTKVVARAGG
jgi:hypothetical protein